MSIFNVGDLVRVRQWDDMASQHRVSESGCTILCKCGFTKDMLKYGLCGKEFIVKSTDEFIVYGHETPFYISDDMLELVDDVAIEDTEEMDKFLQSIQVRE